MLQQVLFTDSPSPRNPRGRDSVFYALMPPQARAVEMSIVGERLAHLHHLDVRGIRPERLHVSLHNIGRFDGVPHDVVARAKVIGTDVAGMIAPFSVVFDHAQVFSGHRAEGEPRPLVLRESVGSSALHDLHRALGIALQESGLGGGPSIFTPHVTLLYTDENIPDYGVPEMQWCVNELVLIHSLIGRNRYRELGRWRLKSSKRWC